MQVQDLTANTTVITANRRIANYLRAEYDKVQQARGKISWQSPTILPWQTWLIQLWQQCHQGKFLLNAHQERWLWELIIRAEQNPLLMQPQHIAELVQQAWQFMQQWNVPYKQLKYHLNEDVRAFLSFAEKFENICRKHNYIDQACISGQIITAINNNQLQLPKQILLAGFDELPPRSRQLVTLLEQQSDINWLSTTNTAQSIHVVATANIEQEIQTMVRWVKQQFTENKRIGCVVPNLTELRDHIESALTKFDEQLPFNISAGLSLCQYPLIQTAFALLNLGDKNTLINISGILLSPFIKSSEQEYIARAKLDAYLRGFLEHEIHLGLLKAGSKKFTPILYRCLNYFTQLIEHQTQPHSPSFWAKHFIKILTAFGWPGNRSLTSSEYQLQQRFINLHHEFSALDWVCQTMSYAEAIKQLIAMTQRTIFQAKTDESPIQVLGMLEVTGQKFDVLWVMNMHAENFPATAKPNPFLPVTLQRELAMPHASCERELYFAKMLLQRFCQSANEIIFSYPEQENDKLLSPSPLLSDFSKTTIDALKLPEPIDQYQTIANSKEIEYLLDNKAPALKPDEMIAGGTGIIKSQSVCPFQAFVQYRLAAHGIDEPSKGLTANERGLLLHQVLESIWQQINSQQKLSALSELELEKLIQQTVVEVLQKYRQVRPYTLTKSFIAVEQKRLVLLTKKWLEYEKERPLFTVIAEETRIETNIAGLSIHMQIDRIDQLESGETIIIDYKTSKPGLRALFGERLDEPQLPLYCVSNSKPIQGVLFAQINPNLMRFKGITAEDYKIPDVYHITQLNVDGMPTSWEELKQIWQAQINQLSEEFVKGFAEVSPSNSISTCQYCEFKTLCRIHEVQNAHD